MKNTSKILMYVIQALTLLGFLSTVVWLVVSFNPAQKLETGIAIIAIVVYIIVFLYALYGYKKPHGNMLRYTFIIFAVSLALYAYSTLASPVSAVPVVINVLCTVPIAYVAGRLHKFNQNKVLLYVALVMLLIAAIIDCILFTKSMVPEVGGFVFVVLKFSTFNKFILGLALATTYVNRFHTHKEAGLIDDEKKAEK